MSIATKSFLVSLTLLVHFFQLSAQQTWQADHLYAAQATLGEGAFWDERIQKWYWIDIEEGYLFTYDPDSAATTEMPMFEKIGTVVPTKSPGSVVVALQSGIYNLNFITGKKRFLTHPEARKPNLRYNDGKCDPQGRFWVGSMAMNAKGQEGTLWKITPSPITYKNMFSPVGVSNGIVWSLDGKTMYYVDSPTKTILSFNFNAATGNINDEKVCVEIPEGMGVADGMAIDAEGKLWTAQWGGNCVARWDPKNGQLIGKVNVPAPHVTSVSFGGPNLNQLFITTARQGLSEQQKTQFPQSGDLFICHPGVNGVINNKFKR